MIVRLDTAADEYHILTKGDVTVEDILKFDILVSKLIADMIKRIQTQTLKQTQILKKVPSNR